MESKKDDKKLQHQIAGFLEIPTDVMLDLPKITLIGNLQLYIENHRGIIEYRPEDIRISVSTGELEVSREEIYLDGVIQALRFNQ
jgi:sporulation protein YqfC